MKDILGQLAGNIRGTIIILRIKTLLVRDYGVLKGLTGAGTQRKAPSS